MDECTTHRLVNTQEQHMDWLAAHGLLSTQPERPDARLEVELQDMGRPQGSIMRALQCYVIRARRTLIFVNNTVVLPMPNSPRAPLTFANSTVVLPMPNRPRAPFTPIFKSPPHCSSLNMLSYLELAGLPATWAESSGGRF